MRRDVLKVLVFADDRFIADLLANILKYFGHHPLVYADPQSCPLYIDPRCSCSNDEPCADVIFIGTDLEERSGVDFLSRQRDRGCKAPAENIALLGAELSPEQAGKVRELGCRYFNVPFLTLEIVRWLDQCLERKKGFPASRP
ncbi:MAG: hypothetical protein RQ754_06770 [Desulfuromonadales bacterium]|nr:hypothetical protein [Desulfuromonadales bacterium]